MKKPKCIEVRSIVSSRNLEPYVSMFLIYDDGSEDQVTQWTPEEAYRHAMRQSQTPGAPNEQA